jgi:pyruvate/2-oxoglutarate dehydrogenase complex dihydrolipoamide dehydrogenase (E3) component
MLADAQTDKILGVHIIGANASLVIIKRHLICSRQSIGSANPDYKPSTR